MPATISKVIVAVAMAAIYAAFCWETIALRNEFRVEDLWFKLAFIYSHNFLFFPIAGLLALVAFYRPAVIVVDALACERIHYGRVVLAAGLVAMALAAFGIADMFGKSNARSVYEVAPQAILADTGASETSQAPARAPLADALIRLRIAAMAEEGLAAYRNRCEAEWLAYAPRAQETSYCFVTGGEATGAQCCQAKTAFRQNINALEATTPSNTSIVHRIVLPIKTFFLLALLALGAAMVRFRKKLTELYGPAVEDMSFPMAVGGAVMMLWPLMNAAYLESFALFTGDGTTNSYKLTAPLYALGFGIWALLLVFFHLRSYPSQMEYAARLGGLAVAGVGVLQYQGLIDYIGRTLGAGGGWLPLIIFTLVIGVLTGAVLTGVRPQDIDFDNDGIKG